MFCYVYATFACFYARYGHIIFYIISGDDCVLYDIDVEAIASSIVEESKKTPTPATATMTIAMTAM